MSAKKMLDARLDRLLDVSFLCLDWLDKLSGLGPRESDPLGDRPTTFSQLKCGGIIQRYPEGLRMKDLAVLLRVTPGAATQMVETFVRLGLVERFTKPEDRRSVYVRMSKAGRATSRSLYTRFQAHGVPLFAGVSADELETFCSVLDRVSARLLERLAPPAGK